jgi:hypothetical protein
VRVFPFFIPPQEIPFPSFMSPKAQSLIGRLLDVNDKTRLGSGPNGAKDIMAHPFFEGELLHRAHCDVECC